MNAVLILLAPVKAGLEYLHHSGDKKEKKEKAKKHVVHDIELTWLMHLKNKVEFSNKKVTPMNRATSILKQNLPEDIKQKKKEKDVKDINTAKHFLERLTAKTIQM